MGIDAVASRVLDLCARIRRIPPRESTAIGLNACSWTSCGAAARLSRLGDAEERMLVVDEVSFEKNGRSEIAIVK
jgi:hypothetical protein